MELIFNDCSIHGQFQDFATFRAAIQRIMMIRNVARQFGRQVQCHRNVANACVTSEWNMRRAAGMLRRDEQRALMRWLNFLGPFWDDVRRHGPDDWFECENKIVTDTAVGESGWLSLHEKIDCSLVSIAPSQWMTSPLSVVWVDNENRTRVEVPNFWDQETLKSALSNAPMTISSWEEMNESARSRYPSLTFANDWCEPLRGTPFVKSAAERVLSRLSVLHDLKGCFNANGERTSKGHDIYRTYFVGDRAWFTDSSDSEEI